MNGDLAEGGSDATRSRVGGVSTTRPFTPTAPSPGESKSPQPLAGARVTPMDTVDAGGRIEEEEAQPIAWILPRVVWGRRSTPQTAPPEGPSLRSRFQNLHCVGQSGRRSLRSVRRARLLGRHRRKQAPFLRIWVRFELLVMKRPRRRYRVPDVHLPLELDAFGWGLRCFGQTRWDWFDELVVGGLGLRRKTGAGQRRCAGVHHRPDEWPPRSHEVIF